MQRQCLRRRGREQRRRHGTKEILSACILCQRCRRCRESRRGLQRTLTHSGRRAVAHASSCRSERPGKKSLQPMRRAEPRREGRCTTDGTVNKMTTCRRGGHRLGARTLDRMVGILVVPGTLMASEGLEVVLGRETPQAPEGRMGAPRRDKQLELVELGPHRVDRHLHKHPVSRRTSSASCSRTAR